MLSDTTASFCNVGNVVKAIFGRFRMFIGSSAMSCRYRDVSLSMYICSIFSIFSVRSYPP